MHACTHTRRHTQKVHIRTGGETDTEIRDTRFGCKTVPAASLFVIMSVCMIMIAVILSQVPPHAVLAAHSQQPALNFALAQPAPSQPQPAPRPQQPWQSMIPNPEAHHIPNTAHPPPRLAPSEPPAHSYPARARVRPTDTRVTETRYDNNALFRDADRLREPSHVSNRTRGACDTPIRHRPNKSSRASI